MTGTARWGVRPACGEPARGASRIAVCLDSSSSTKSTKLTGSRPPVNPSATRGLHSAQHHGRAGRGQFVCIWSPLCHQRPSTTTGFRGLRPIGAAGRHAYVSLGFARGRTRVYNPVAVGAATAVVECHAAERWSAAAAGGAVLRPASTGARLGSASRRGSSTVLCRFGDRVAGAGLAPTALWR